MKKMANKSGFILMLTLMIISLCTVVVTYIFNTGSVFVPYADAMSKQEKAKTLAFSGLQLALSQLASSIELDKKQPQQPAAPGAQPTQASVSPDDQLYKKLLATILPSLNRWQTYALTQKIDGIEGEINISITSEDGKIDINAMYDFEKHTFKGNDTQKAIAKTLLTETFKSVGKPELYPAFEKFLKDRKYRLDDVTELLVIKGFEAFRQNIFYEPPRKGSKEDRKKAMYLTDIFTVWSGKQTIDPWLLSDTLCGLVGVKRAESGDVGKRKQMIDQVLKNFKSNYTWPADWKSLFVPLYDQEFTTLPKGIEFILSTKFEPQLFSVLSYGKVGNVTQKLLAIVESKKEIKEKEQRAAFNVTIKKIYWL